MIALLSGSVSVILMTVGVSSVFSASFDAPSLLFSFDFLPPVGFSSCTLMRFDGMTCFFSMFGLFSLLPPLILRGSGDTLAGAAAVFSIVENRFPASLGKREEQRTGCWRRRLLRLLLAGEEQGGEEGGDDERDEKHRGACDRRG